MLGAFAKRPFGPHAIMRMIANLNWNVNKVAAGKDYKGKPEDFLPWVVVQQKSRASEGNAVFGIPDEEDD